MSGQGQERKAGGWQMFRDSGGMTLIGLLGTAFGFLTQVVLASRFGTSGEMDAYLVSLTIPAMVVAIFTGSLNYTFIPVFVERKSAGNEDDAWRTVSNVFNILALVFLALSVVCILLAGRIVGIIAPGLPAAAALRAGELLRIQAPVILLSGLTAFLSGIYFAEKRFFYPTAAAVLTSLILFLSIYLFSDLRGMEAAAWGSLAGNGAALCLLLPVMFRGGRYRRVLDPADDGTVRILKLLAPLLVGAVFYRGDDLVQRFIASSLSPGSIASLGYAFKLLSTCSGLLVTGISVVFLQRVSELSCADDARGVGTTFAATFRWLTYFVIPVIVIFVLAGEEIVTLLFRRGRFDAAAARDTWTCLVLYSGVLYGGIIGSITTPIFYAYKNTRLVVAIGISGALLQVLLSAILAHFLATPGLPLAYSLSSLTTIGVFLAVLNRRYVRLPFREMGGMLLRVSAAGTGTALLLLPLRHQLLASAAPLLRVMLLVPLAALVYLTGTALLRVAEAGELKLLLQKAVCRLVPVEGMEK